MGKGGSAGVRASGRKTVLTAYLDGSLELEQDGLVDKNFSRLCAQILYLVLLQLDRLAWTISAHCDVVVRGRRGCWVQSRKTAHLQEDGQ